MCTCNISKMKEIKKADAKERFWTCVLDSKGDFWSGFLGLKKNHLVEGVLNAAVEVIPALAAIMASD